MPVTNFTSVISAQSVGTADVQALASSFDKLSGSIDGAGKKSNELNQHPGFNAFADKVRQGIENPLAAIGSGAESALKALGPVGTGVAAVGAAFAAAGIAVFEAAKGLGEYATQIQNVSLRTGLSAKEVGQFSFAARVAGQDVSVFETAMRKLSQGLTDGSEEGKKAREALKDLGVVAQDIYGKAVPMSSVFLQISEGLNRMTNPAQRNTEALRLFGRAGIELLPTLLGLSQNLKRAQELGLGPSDKDIGQWLEYQRRIVEVEASWDKLVRKFKAGAVAAVSIVVGDGKEIHDRGLAVHGDVFSQTAVNSDIIGDSLKRMVFANMAMARNAPFVAPIAENDRTVAAALMGTTEEQLTAAKAKLATDQASLKTGVLPEVNKATFDAIAADKAQIASLEARIKATKDLDATIKGVIATIEAQTKLDNDTTTKLLNGGRQLYLQPSDGTSPWAANEIFGGEAKTVGGLVPWAWLAAMRPKSQDEQAANLNSWWTTNVADQVRRSESNIRLGRMGDSFDIRKAQGRGDSPDDIYSLQLSQIDKEYEAAKNLAVLKNDAIALDQALADKTEKRYQAQIDKEEALADLAEKQKQSFQTGAVDFVRALQSRNASGFFTSFARKLEDEVVGAGAGMVFGDPQDRTGISRLIPHAKSGTFLGDLLSKTPFGPNPFKDTSSLKLAGAGDHLFTAADALIGAARVLSGGTTAGGGYGWGSSPAITKLARFNPFSAANNNGIEGGMPDGYVQPSVAGMNLMTGYEDMNHNPIAPGSTVPSGGFGWGTAAGVSAALAGGGFGIYSGIHAGGAQGALTAAGSGIGAAGALTSLLIPSLSSTLGPIGMAVGLGLGLVSTLLGDPKKNRANDLATQQQERSFTMPTGVDYSMDASGRYVDSNYMGQVRTVTAPITVYAMDSKSFTDYLLANPGPLATGISTAIAGGNADDIAGSLKPGLGLA